MRSRVESVSPFWGYQQKVSQHTGPMYNTQCAGAVAKLQFFGFASAVAKHVGMGVT